jgi:hypothetical protein
MKVNTEVTDSRQAAAEIRKIADEVESEDFIAVVISFCDGEGQGVHACVTDRNRGTPELINAMINEVRELCLSQGYKH